MMKTEEILECLVQMRRSVDLVGELLATDPADRDREGLHELIYAAQAALALVAADVDNLQRELRRTP